jgi:hypothetical protein
MIKKFLCLLKSKKTEKPDEYILEFRTEKEKDRIIRDLAFAMAFSKQKQIIEILSPTKIKIIKYKK